MIELRTGKTRKQLTAVKEPMAMAIIATIDAMREWWPLTVRQVHYQLLNNPPMRNAKRGPSTGTTRSRTMTSATC